MKDWFNQSDALDNLIKENYGDLVVTASRGELDLWRSRPQGRLAEIIVLDQFTRNIHRDSPLAYSNDSRALALSQEAIRLNRDVNLATLQKLFLYLPHMHSESLFIQDQSVSLHGQLGLDDSHQSAIKHRRIIRLFGRFPHRNKVLGRISTKEEKSYLDEHRTFF